MANLNVLSQKMVAKLESDRLYLHYMPTYSEGLAMPGVSNGIWSKSPILKSPFTKSPFTKSPFVERPMLKRALFIGNQLGLVSVYTSVESDKKVLDWF